MVWTRPACRAWEEARAGPGSFFYAFLVTKAIPRQGQEWPVWAHMPATSMEAAGANVHSLQLLPLPQNTLCLLKNNALLLFSFPGKSSTFSLRI